MDTLYAPPRTELHVPLTEQPRLECWERKDHPAQVALKKYLDGIEALRSDRLVDGPLALALHVGLPEPIPLDEGGRDLDNYLMPLARRIGPGRLVAAFASKGRGGQSTVAVDRAEPAPYAEGKPQLEVRTTGAADTVAWKQQIHDRCREVAGGPTAGPIAVTIKFGVARGRNWSTLWKPTIDSLGPMLGISNPLKPFHPDDDRIVEIQLHRAIRDDIGHDVLVDVWWRPAGGLRA